jgi:hypothetical protein
MVAAVDISNGARRMYFRPISWQAIFAALAVGIAVQLLLMLAGVAFGGLAIEPGDTSAQQMGTTAGLWSAISMLIAAFLGGYVAARASGLRRKGDGMLHGVVSWAASTLLYAFLATTVLSAATAGLYNELRPMVSQAMPQSMQQTPARIDRGEVEQTLRRLGLSPEQVNNVMNQAQQAAGGEVPPQTQATIERNADRIGAASGSLALAVLLSLIAAVLGGLSGTVSQRRVNRHTTATTTYSTDTLSPADARVVHRPL